MDKRFIITAGPHISGVAIQPVYAFGSVATLEAAENFADQVARYPTGDWQVFDILKLNRLRDFGLREYE